MSLKEHLSEVFHEELIRAQLLEKISDPSHVTDELVEYIKGACAGNPWNAGPLYLILKMHGAFDTWKNGHRI